MTTAAASVQVAEAAPGCFRRPFRSWLGFDIRTGVLLLAVASVLRAALVLQANETGQYQALSIAFIAMAVLPWVLLTAQGRRRVGIVRPARWQWLLPGALAGAVTCLGIFTAFSVLWGETLQNPFVFIGGTYSAVPPDVSGADRAIYFAVFAVIGVTFSPIGEELLYRGVAHESFAARLGTARAVLIDGAAFALVHLAHFGVVYAAGAWMLLPGPALLWVIAMFASSLVFHAFRVLTGSIVGAVCAHAGFNLAMTAVIFYALDVL